MSEEYDLDAAAAEVVRERLGFRYQGRSWSLAHIADVDWRVIEKADSGEIGTIREAFHAGFGCVHDGDDKATWMHTPAALEFDELPQPISAMNALFDRWLRHGGLRKGESEASPDSSESAAGPSNRASRRATKSTTAKSSRAR
jgi:hypothetical protein